VDFGLIPTVSIGSTVFLDRDNDGLYEPADGESGIPNVQVILQDDLSNPIDTITTNGAGDYFFGDLPEGDYKVVIPATQFGSSAALADYPNSSTDIATSGADNETDNDDNGSQSGGVGTMVMSPVINLAAKTEPEDGEETLSGNAQDDALDANGDMTIDFGFYANMSIGSLVWADTNADGMKDPAEIGVEDVELILYNTGADSLKETSDDVLIAKDTTESDGTYFFGNLAPGDYFISVVPPDTLNMSSITTVSIDNAADDDDNGIQTAAGDSICSPVITLRVNDEAAAETGLGGTQDTNPGSTDVNGNMTVDFGLVPTVCVGSLVWIDSNNNGVKDANEDPIEGVVVKVYEDSDQNGEADGVFVGTDTTDVFGNYLITGLAPGDYVVGVTPPDTLNMSSTTTVTLDNSADDDDNGIQAKAGDEILSPSLSLRSNEETITNETGSGNNLDATDDNNGDMTVDFGLIQSMTLGNKVWNDLDNNGMFDGAEVGVPGLKVMLYEDNDQNGEADGAAIDSSTTNSDGFYKFESLVEGDYVLGLMPPDSLRESSAPTQILDNGVDNDDNGIQDNPGEMIMSPSINLRANTEPTSTESNEDGISDSLDDNNGDMTIDFGINEGPLPVELLSLNAQVVNKKVRLVWQVTQEINLEKYNIERSYDGSVFTTIGTVPANNRNQYSYIDNSALHKVVYYRLSMFNLDRSSEKSEIVAVNFDDSKRIALAPNPFTDKLNLLYEQDAGVIKLIEIFDLQGKLMSRYSKEDIGNSLDLSYLSNGAYIIQITFDEFLQIEKIVKH
ncbi:MAG: SdrD B-like domain-containing protein, partial [Bacteroidota bacterium]